ncbi:hypothetical protein NEOKW01_1207 [Nematocida sp. AWRm80]|nr:hypothetical protein NEOKW01_1207 [Nematocida sp. AWRm80]
MSEVHNGFIFKCKEVGTGVKREEKSKGPVLFQFTLSGNNKNKSGTTKESVPFRFSIGGTGVASETLGRKSIPSTRPTKKRVQKQERGKRVFKEKINMIEQMRLSETASARKESVSNIRPAKSPSNLNQLDTEKNKTNNTQAPKRLRAQTRAQKTAPPETKPVSQPKKRSRPSRAQKDTQKPVTEREPIEEQRVKEPEEIEITSIPSVNPEEVNDNLSLIIDTSHLSEAQSITLEKDYLSSAEPIVDNNILETETDLIPNSAYTSNIVPVQEYKIGDSINNNSADYNIVDETITHQAHTPLNRKSVGGERDRSYVKLQRMSLDALMDRKVSVFRVKRESLFGYDQIYTGSIRPNDFYKHCNSSLDNSARIKQVLQWIVTYVHNGHIPVAGVSPEKVKEICEMLLKKISSLSLKSILETEAPVTITEEAQNIITTLQREKQSYSREIEKWRIAYQNIGRRYRVSMPLSEEEHSRRVSLSFTQHNSSILCDLVSFDRTVIIEASNDVLSLCKRRIELLNSVLNSSRYFISLSLEYTNRIASTLLAAAHPLDIPKANALLEMLCKVTRRQLI